MTGDRPVRVMIVCINYAPEIISTGLYTTGLAEYLAREGFETHVVTALPYYPAWRTFEGWRRPWWKSRVSEDGARITHCPIYVPAKPSGIKRILHYISFALSALPILWGKALRRRPDIVVAIAPSLINAPGVLSAAKIAGGVSWLHIQDYEVEAAFATGLLTEDSRIGRMAKTFEQWVLGRFDKISSISAPMLDKLREKGVQEERIVEFRNWANLTRVKPMPVGSSPLKAALGITTEYVALYSGNLANKQGLEILPEIARKLSHRDDLTIAVCGDGPMREPLEKMSADLPMIRFFPLQPMERLSDLLGIADVHLLPQIAGAADLVLPSKLTNMLASGRPTIATTEADTALGQEVENCGVVVPPGDAVRLANALESLIAAPQKRAEMGAAARQRAIERWDMDAILYRLKSQFEDLSRNRAKH